MSNPSSIPSRSIELHSIDIHIPQQLHQEPVLATLISSYNLIVNFKAAVLDRKATGGGWFNLNLEGDPQDINAAVNYLDNLGVEVFSHHSVPLVQDLDPPARSVANSGDNFPIAMFIE
jgi:NIL domain